MNSTIQRILLRPHRSSQELDKLLQFMVGYKHFQYLAKLDSYEELLLGLMGFFMPSNEYVYEQNEENDEQVFFIINGEASKIYNDKKTNSIGLNTAVRRGDFFGCYDDPKRLESVKTVQDCFFVRMHRKYYVQLSEYNRYMIKVRSQVMRQLFPQLSQNQSSSQYLKLINVASYVEKNQGEILMKPSAPIGGEYLQNPLQQDTTQGQNVNLDDGFMYILLEGQCDVSADIQMDDLANLGGRQRKIINHFICHAIPNQIIGDEQLFTHNEWKKITKKMPNPYSIPEGLNQNETIKSQFFAKITSSKAKFLVLPIQEVLSQFPSEILEPFKYNSKQKLKGYLDNILEFYKNATLNSQIKLKKTNDNKNPKNPEDEKTLSKQGTRRNIFTLKRNNRQDTQVISNDTSNNSKSKVLKSAEQSTTPLQKVKSLSIFRSKKEVSQNPENKSDKFKILQSKSQDYIFPQDLPRPTHHTQTTQTAQAFPQKQVDNSVFKTEKILQRILSEAYDFGQMESARKMIRNRLLTHGLIPAHSPRLKTEYSQIQQQKALSPRAYDPRLVVLGKMIKPKKQMKQYINLVQVRGDKRSMSDY